MFKNINEFINSKEGIGATELTEIFKEIDELDWLYIIKKISDEEYKKKYDEYNERIFRYSITFGENIREFTESLILLMGNERALKVLIHELKHVEYYKKWNIKYVFGIIKFSGAVQENDIIKMDLDPFVYGSYEDVMLLKPRDRILFLIEVNEAPEDMSEGDKNSSNFWKDKLKEFDKSHKDLSKEK